MLVHCATFSWLVRAAFSCCYILRSLRHVGFMIYRDQMQPQESWKHQRAKSNSLQPQVIASPGMRRNRNRAWHGHRSMITTMWRIYTNWRLCPSVQMLRKGDVAHRWCQRVHPQSFTHEVYSCCIPICPRSGYKSSARRECVWRYFVCTMSTRNNSTGPALRVKSWGSCRRF